MTYIMPAGTLGAAAYYVLRDGQTEISGFLDNIKGKTEGAEFCGLSVYTPDNIDRNAKVIVASFWNGRELTRQLEKLGFTDIVSADAFLTPDNAYAALEQIRADEIERRFGLGSVEDALKSYFIDYGGGDDRLTLLKVEFVVTQRCTLRCRDCAALMQYYASPADISMDTTVDSVDKLFERVDFIRVVNIIGGEPFISKELPILLKKLIEYRSRIGELTIITNGTLIPDDDTITAIKQSDAIVMISDYGALSRKKDELLGTLSANGARCEIVPNQYWVAMQSFSDKIRPPDEVFSTCSAHCYQVMDGKLYYCNFAAHGDALRGFPFDRSNYVDLFSPETTKETIREYIFRKQGLPACGYCTGRDITKEHIPIAVQTKKPLPYKKYE